MTCRCTVLQFYCRYDMILTWLGSKSELGLVQYMFFILILLSILFRNFHCPAVWVYNGYVVLRCFLHTHWSYHCFAHRKDFTNSNLKGVRFSPWDRMKVWIHGRCDHLWLAVVFGVESLFGVWFPLARPHDFLEKYFIGNEGSA